MSDLFDNPADLEPESFPVPDIVADCELCITVSPFYDWHLVCCRARFISILPYRWLRSGWMARWKKMETPAFYDRIALEVNARWARLKQQPEAAHG